MHPVHNYAAWQSPIKPTAATCHAFLPPQADPPPGWEWEGSWHVDHGPATDADGWAYAPGVPAGLLGVVCWIRRLLWSHIKALPVRISRASYGGC